MPLPNATPVRVYFNEFNPRLGRAAYLPLTSGTLQAYAQTSDVVRARYAFMPYLFHIDALDRVLAQYESPGVAAFSAAIWNEQLCLRTAAEVKRRWPDCLIVFGGTQVPHHPVEYLQEHPFIDVAVRGEGEPPFKAILERFVEAREFAGIPGIGWRQGGASTGAGTVEVNPDPTGLETDLDTYPSPYLAGLFEDTLRRHPAVRFQALLETNRGCPFHCTYCYWGKGGLSRKYRFHSLDRVAAELDWIGRHGIGFVYNADSNFGMHPRDEEIAGMMVATKRRYGAPEKVVNLYGKNTDERIHRIARALYRAGMHKGLGLSRQSMAEQALIHTKRHNIKLAVYKSLQEKFEADGIPTFTELILGLPGETYDSFAAGLGELLETSLRSQLIIVLCEIYRNTEMAQPAYRHEHGIVARRNVSYGVHSVVQDRRWVTEYIDYVVGTRSLPTPDWIRAGKLAWTTMALTSLRLGYFLLQYLHDRLGVPHLEFLRFLAEGQMAADTGALWREELAHYDAFMRQILDGRGRAVLLAEYGDIYWAIEEASFLRLTAQADRFYAELETLLAQFLTQRGVTCDPEELHEVVVYQRLRTPSPFATAPREYTFQFNLPEFFAASSSEARPPLERRPQRLELTDPDAGQSRREFAEERLLWGRRGGKFERACRWTPVIATPIAQAA